MSTLVQRAKPFFLVHCLWVSIIPGYGQSWSATVDTLGPYSFGMDVSEDASGRVHLATSEASDLNYPIFAKGHFFEFTPSGMFSGHSRVQFPHAGVTPNGILYNEPLDEVLLFSTVYDSLAWTTPRATSIGFSRFSTGLSLLGQRAIETGYSRAGQTACRTGSDRITVATSGSFYPDVFTTTIRLFDLDMAGDSLGNDSLYHGVGGATSLMVNSNGGIVLATTLTGWSNTYSGGEVTYLNADHSVASVFGTPSFNDTLDAYNTIHQVLNVVPLNNSDIILAGGIQPNAHYKGLVQRTDSTLASVIAQFLPWTDSYGDFPALTRCISKNVIDELFYGQTEYFSPLLLEPYPGTPSRARIWKLDTDLNVLGTYTFDGFADSSYYLLRSVRATADGGALVSGSVADIHINAQDTRTRAWVAKIAPEDFATGLPEQARVQGWVFPNPGSSGFELMLAERINEGSLTVTDVQGRTVKQQRLSGINFHVAADNIPSGCYLVKVCDISGDAVYRTTWIRE